jgi:hypothetical protein
MVMACKHTRLDRDAAELRVVEFQRARLPQHGYIAFRPLRIGIQWRNPPPNRLTHITAPFNFVMRQYTFMSHWLPTKGLTD